MLSFEQPLILLLLLPILLLVYLTWRNMSLPFSARQRYLILASRLLLFTLIICALAGASWQQSISRQTTIFVGDLSDSTSSQRPFIEQWINTALQHKGSEDQVGIVAVGRNALVEQSIKTQIDFAHFESTPDTNYTDLSAGLRLAAAIMPTNTQKHIILLTDGQQNLGDALQEAQLLQQEGIRLDVVPVPTASGPDARIDNLNAPSQLHTNEHFVMHVQVYSSVQQTGTIRIFLDQGIIVQKTLALVAGEQDLSFDLIAPPPGFHSYRVQLDAPQDTILQNNEASAFVSVQGPPTVLLIEGTRGNGVNIANALKATKINVVIGTPNDVPISLDGLAAYSSVVLVDVPAVDLGNARMQTLQSFVRDLGRGLVVSGGQSSYGLGDYAGTPLEETLPVRMDIPQHKDTPNIAVVLIIESLEAPLPVNISKEAAKGVISLLTPNDQVGISAGYGTLAIPMQHVTDKAAINKAIDGMDPTDPGSYNPDLANAERVLLNTNASIRHVILLGDGDAFDNYAPQVTKMAKENITVSTVATNSADYQELGTMINIATWGKGRFYRADDPSVIPQVLLKETERAARRAIINEPFTPAVVGTHPILSGLKGFPELDGYVSTTPKPAAQMVLVSHRDDPVLAVWQYGLGRAVAWTSDARGLWTSHWLQWNQAAQWWANLVTWTLPAADSSMNISGKVLNGTGQITVNLPTTTTGGQQQVQAHIIAPDHSQQTISLQPTAPQQWAGNFSANPIGVYVFQVIWQGLTANGTPGRLAATTGMVVPYSPEFRTRGTDMPFLQQLARAGGGQLLGPEDSVRAFLQNLVPVTAALPITFLLLVLAALLLPIDIAARRLSSLEFLVVGWRWLAGLFSPARTRLATSPHGLKESSSSIGATLGSVRTQRQERRSRVQPPTPIPLSREPVRTKAEKATAATPTQPKELSTTERLLEAKRKRTQVEDAAKE
ncbi:MAG TPA: VWA domain-containing protein [Ktedonobacteraceae bacterium]|nr:VWA domain-containing protein [Ktedonobacteraceae bacterium]